MPNFCVDAPAYLLESGSPANGTYSGTGVNGDYFNAGNAGVGTHNITYTYTDINGCTNSASNTISVGGIPTAAFNIDPPVCAPGCIITFNSTSNNYITTWDWDFGDSFTKTVSVPMTTHSYSSSGNYNVVLNVSGPFGCHSTTNREIIIIEIETPNVFTPNGNGLNEYFVISGIDKIHDSRLVVYNRWGERVYENPDYKNDWNGGKCADGVYFFILSFYNNILPPIKGSITIIR